jgi:AGCS family alanine or glycine:cation symporter
MEILQNLLNGVNDILWSYVLIVLLIGCAVLFTVRTRFVQFRMIGEMFRLLGDAVPKVKKEDGKPEVKHISSFQAFMISLASRIGTGNLAGVATAISLGGPGAVFWMWIIALMGSASAFIESTLAQLYKRRSKDSFIGGPAYYMLHGLGMRWMGVLFAILISITFGLAYNSVQSNTICAAWQKAFNVDVMWMGIALTVLTLVIIFGGIQRIAKVSEALVPFMAIGYLLIAVGVIVCNITSLPHILAMIVKGAFGWHQAIGGGMGAAVMQGIKRGLFSNEAGEGSAPNAAATAYVTHPVKQGLIQALGVFTDTLVVCSCTAFIILVSGVNTDSSLNGIQLTQQALTAEIGPIGNTFIAITILLFAYSSVIGNYYYGEANIRFITHQKWVLNAYRIFVGGMVLWGSLMTLDLAWSMADLMMALLTMCNLVAIVLLSKQAIWLLNDYRAQKRQGIKSPVFTKDKMPDIEDKLVAW